MLKLNPFSTLLQNLLRGLTFYAFDPKDPDTVAAIKAAVEEETGGLKEKVAELIGKLKKAQKGAEIDPADVEKLETERDTLKTQLSDAQKQLNAAKKTAEEATKALDGEKSYNQKLLIDNGISAALLEAGVKDPAFSKAAAALLRTSAKVEIKAEGDERIAVVGDKKLGEFVKAWSQSDEGKAFVSAPGNSGGGATGSGSGAAPVNPWAAETLNLTQQAKIMQENPTLAQSFQTAAGATTP